MTIEKRSNECNEAVLRSRTKCRCWLKCRSRTVHGKPAVSDRTPGKPKIRERMLDKVEQTRTTVRRQVWPWTNNTCVPCRRWIRWTVARSRPVNEWCDSWSAESILPIFPERSGYDRLRTIPRRAKPPSFGGEQELSVKKRLANYLNKCRLLKLIDWLAENLPDRMGRPDRDEDSLATSVVWNNCKWPPSHSMCWLWAECTRPTTSKTYHDPTFVLLVLRWEMAGRSRKSKSRSHRVRRRWRWTVHDRRDIREIRSHRRVTKICTRPSCKTNNGSWQLEESNSNDDEWINTFYANPKNRTIRKTSQTGRRVGSERRFLTVNVFFIKME